LQAEGCTVVIVVLNEKPLGLIAVKDKIKETTPAGHRGAARASV
jgi:cation transport ATPase